MAFSLIGILSVILEVLRPLLPLLVILLAIDALLVVLVLRSRRQMQFATATRVAAGIFAVVFVIALLAVPPFTGASYSSMNGALDWLALFGASLGAAAVCAALSWAPLQLLYGRA